jgi:hypothetical protein
MTNSFESSTAKRGYLRPVTLKKPESIFHRLSANKRQNGPCAVQASSTSISFVSLAASAGEIGGRPADPAVRCLPTRPAGVSCLPGEKEFRHAFDAIARGGF